MTPAQQINAQVLAFLRKRENQFRMVERSGRSIPHIARKMQAIANIRTQMEGATNYNERGQAWAVVHVENQIRYILPAADSRFNAMRERVLAIIDYCHEQVVQKTQNHGQTINAGQTINCISR